MNQRVMNTIKINSITTLLALFLANYCFAMEQKNGKIDAQEKKEIKADFTKILPKETTSTILNFCLDDLEYPKTADAKKSENFKNLRATCKLFKTISKNIVEDYDQKNEQLFTRHSLNGCCN